jgi:hypothetical protein
MSRPEVSEAFQRLPHFGQVKEILIIAEGFSGLGAWVSMLGNGSNVWIDSSQEQDFRKTNCIGASLKSIMVPITDNLLSFEI